MKGQQSRRAGSSRVGSNILSKAGKLVVDSSHHSLLQEVGDDEDFAPISNITTTYLEQPNVAGLSPPGSELALKSHYSKSPPKHTSSDFEYKRIAAQLRSNSKAHSKGIEKKKEEKLKMFMKGQDESLADVEDMIGEIQSLVSGGVRSETVSFKPKADKGKKVKKHQWSGKAVSTFEERSTAFSKLEELLLNYKLEQKMPDPPQKIEDQLPPERKDISDRRRRQLERAERNKKYQEVQKQLVEASYGQDTQVVKKSQSQIRDEIKEERSEPQEGSAEEIPEESYEQNFEEKEEKEEKEEEEEQEGQKNELKLKLEDIQFVEIEWNKLPIILNPFNSQNSELFLRVRDFPDDQTFLEAINEILAQETQYQNYSIFDPKRTAGMKHRVLQSQEQFRQSWAEQWQRQIEDESTKQMLGELDFQWYRSLIQLTYSHSLEEILVKNIKYDPDIYLNNLKKINGGQGNDKNKVVDNLSVPFRVILNRLRVTQALLAKFSQEHQQRRGRNSVIVGVIPSISEQMSKEQKTMLKEWVQKMYIGGLYNSQGQTSMAIVVPLDQAKASKVQRLSPGEVKLGETTLLINTSETNEKGTKILLRPERMKNSSVRISIVKPKEQEYVLEVGQELYCGRRYSIDLQ